MVTASLLCDRFLSAPFPGTEPSSHCALLVSASSLPFGPHSGALLLLVLVPSQEVPVLDTYLSKGQLRSSRSSDQNAGVILHPFYSFTSALEPSANS